MKPKPTLRACGLNARGLTLGADRIPMLASGLPRLITEGQPNQSGVAAIFSHCRLWAGIGPNGLEHDKTQKLTAPPLSPDSRTGIGSKRGQPPLRSKLFLRNLREKVRASRKRRTSFLFWTLGVS